MKILTFIFLSLLTCSVFGSTITVVNTDVVPCSIPYSTGVLVVAPSTTVVLPNSSSWRSAFYSIGVAEVSGVGDWSITVLGASVPTTWVVEPPSEVDYTVPLGLGFAAGWLWYGFGWLLALVKRPTNIHVD